MTRTSNLPGRRCIHKKPGRAPHLRESQMTPKAREFIKSAALTDYLGIEMRIRAAFFNPRTSRAAGILFEEYFLHSEEVFRGEGNGRISSIFRQAEVGLKDHVCPDSCNIKELASWYSSKSLLLCTYDDATGRFTLSGNLGKLLSLLNAAREDLSRTKKEFEAEIRGEEGKACTLYTLSMEDLEYRTRFWQQGVLLPADFDEIGVLLRGIDERCNRAFEKEFAPLREAFLEDVRRSKAEHSEKASPL